MRRSFGGLVVLAALVAAPGSTSAQTAVAGPERAPARTALPTGLRSLTPPLAVPPPAAPWRAGDPVTEGVLIGGAAGLVGGFIVAPYLLCGGFDDSECAVIVRVAVGLPVLAGGMIVGGLIDKHHVQGPVVWKDGRGTREIRIGRLSNGAAVQITWRLH